MSNQHLSLRGVCSGKYCWVEVFQTLEACWVALEAPPVLAGPSAVAFGAPPSPPTGVSAPCAAAFLLLGGQAVWLPAPLGDAMRKSAPGLPPLPTTL